MLIFFFITFFFPAVDKDSKKMSAKEALMTWVQQNTGSYSDVPVRDFHVRYMPSFIFIF